ncbi:hypothetical protein L3Q82_018450 [Scortum barcoo]|uniref:Uncharacterized protein n=1 Tax=Scortum barcoo TaxID=214431 RepID=A0ACB8VEC1_9TELE|nr:hypothetical protein L3Q82_018450 [Scortum barcoo]
MEEHTETFVRQTELILGLAAESAASVLLQRLHAGGAGSEQRAQLTAVLDVTSREAVRKICRVFRELYGSLVKENKALKQKVGQLESKLRSKVERNCGAEKSVTQTCYKIKPSDGPARSLDVNQPAANPAALAMAILSSSKSRRRAGSSPQVPLVIISQPLPGPVTSQSSPALQGPPEEPDQTVANLQTKLVLEMNQISTDPEEPPGDVPRSSAHITPLPVANDQPSSESRASEDTPTPEDEQTVVVEAEMKMESDELTGTETQPVQSEEEQKELERKRRRELYKEKRFFCELCNKGFHQKHQLRKHVSCHLKPFPCSSCDKGFYKAKSLQKHLLTHQLREAQENDPDKLLHCDQCDRKFRLLRQLRLHQASHRLEKTPLKCQICNRTFTSASALRYHEVSHAQVKPFMCDVCGKGFTRKKSLREHQTVHTGARPYPCPTCGKRQELLHCQQPARPQEHRVVHSGEKPFMCQTCGLSFGLKYNFQRHLRLHNGEKPFRCDKCGEGFTGTWALKTHMLVHGVEKPFMCDLCGKTFFYNCQLQKHQQLVHDNKDKVGGVPGRRRPTGVKPFSCKICFKSFSSNTTLRTHEKSHAENKEFTCDTCGKSFHLRHLYLYHMRQHSGDRPYVCSVCEKGFLLMSQLKQHELLHTGVKPHRCEQCGKEFRTPQNYHRHLLVHTGEKPYECVVCSRKFRQSNQLKSHMQIHTGVKLYTCERCGRGFSDSRQLKKHCCGDEFQSFESGSKRRKQKNEFGSRVGALQGGEPNELSLLPRQPGASLPAAQLAMDPTPYLLLWVRAHRESCQVSLIQERRRRRWRTMAPVSDVDESEMGRRGEELSLDDCRCPVCLEIFMEPVTLPCTHTFCKVYLVYLECFGGFGVSQLSAGWRPDIMVNGDFSTLTRRRGVKVNAGFPCSMEEVGLAVGEVVGHGSVKLAARMNSAVVLFLDQVEKANRIIETGIANGLFVSVGPSSPCPTSCLAVNPLLRRVVSHRRQLYMILNNRDEELNLRFHVRVEDFDYVIFATSAVMKCFGWLTGLVPPIIAVPGNSPVSHRGQGRVVSESRAVIALLPKKDNLQDIKNWRPVSLLCTDYKLLSKALANRLKEAMEQVIHLDQTYCVPGRSVVDNVYLILDVLEVSSSLGINTDLISLDQEKAFDRVEHNFLWKVMERFGFSAGFRITAKIKQLVDAVGPALTDARALGSLLRIRSVRVAQGILELWRQRLSGKEKSLITEYSRKTSGPDPKDPFPEILLSPVLEEASGPLLVTCNPTNLSLHKADNKTLYRNCVKSMNRRGLSGRPLTVWTSRLGADDGGATPQKRVSTWARVNSRKNSLVNQQLWKQIQTSFPLQCERRLSGQDAVAEDDLEVLGCFPRVSQPGELRQEYEDQVTKTPHTNAQRTITVWPSDAVPALQDCFQRTDWQIFREAAVREGEVDLEDYTSAVLGYISKCTEDVTSTRTVTEYPNQKPWLNAEVRSLLKARDAAFRSGDRLALRAARRQLTAGVKRAKAAYGPLSTLPDALNNFYARFDDPNTSPSIRFTPPPGEEPLRVTAAEVRRTLQRINPRKAAGPDNISRRVLKGCPPALCGFHLCTDQQSVRIHDVSSSSISLSTGSPQGCVLSPLLFTLLTYDCSAIYPSCLIVKFADDTAVVGRIANNDESDYRQEVEQPGGLVQTKQPLHQREEDQGDDRGLQKGQTPALSPVHSEGLRWKWSPAGFRYLGVHISDDLTWSKNTSCLIRKAHQRLYFLRRLRRAGLGSSVLTSFYRCVVESVLSSCIIVWHGSCSAAEKKALQRVVKAAQRTVGRKAEGFPHESLPNKSQLKHLLCLLFCCCQLTEEKRVLDEEERRASEEYIQRLLQEEQELLQEERRRREEDERLARLLSDQLNSAAVSQENIRPDVTPAKKKEVYAGQIEKFLSPRPSKSSSSDCSSPSSFTANKENILLSQVKLQDKSPLPKLDYYGTQTKSDTSESPSLHPTSLSASVEDQLLPRSLQTYLTGDGGPLSAKRKSSEVETTEDEEVMATKRVCPPSSSSSTTLDVGGSALQGIAEWEAELLNRRQQEEEDRRLALLLQKELDQEEKQKATNRRKGSSDAYPLRQNRKGKVETSSSNTPSRPPRKTSRTPHSSSASSVKTTNSSKLLLLLLLLLLQQRQQTGHTHRDVLQPEQLNFLSELCRFTISELSDPLVFQS